VCEQLGVADDILDDLERQYEGQRKSELAFQGICKWQEMAGRSAHKDKILKAIQLLGLKRAEGINMVNNVISSGLVNSRLTIESLCL